MKSKFAHLDEQIREILLQNKHSLTPTQIARILLKTKETQVTNPDLNCLKIYIGRHTKRLLDQHEGIYNACENTDIPITSAKNLWIKTKATDTTPGVSAFVVNPYFESANDIEKEIDFLAIFKDKVNRVNVVPICNNVGAFDRVVYTDVHVGMNPNPDGFSLYGGKWDESEIEKRLSILVSHIIENKNADTLYLDELGDFMDGWDGQTVRKGHDLPQNMDNQKAYDVGLGFKIRLIDELVHHYKHIHCNNICNDNHAGAFGYVVNSAFKTIMELKYSNVKVTNIRKFIDHYNVGNYVFILCHGKDGKNLKFGFKATLDNVAMEKIDNYIKEHYLNTKGSVIEFSKGDSHQYLFDNSTSQTFNYYSYPALSPSSEWVQTNFKKGISGFVMFNYYNDRKVINDYLFKWTK